MDSEKEITAFKSKTGEIKHGKEGAY